MSKNEKFILTAVISLLVASSAWGLVLHRDYKQQQHYTSSRTELAQEWMTAKGIVGTVDCRTENDTCDVIPFDPRPVIQLVCRTTTESPACHVNW